MKKKTVIILSSVVAVCALGLVGSYLVDWPVDLNDAGGDIAKSVLFSRKQATEKLTNMEELLQNDSNFKDGIVAAQVVMQTRAAQFASLVDMSNEVAGNIPAFAEVLKEMNAASEMIVNVNNSLAEAGGDLNAALDGEERPQLAQNTINASLAYTTLQKQNNLATRFIETTDKYLETAQGDDRLKFVRDQWLEYQQVTAALEGDNESAEALAKKGNLLSGEKALAAMTGFNLANQISTLANAQMTVDMNIDTPLSNAMPSGLLGQLVSSIRSAAGVTMQQARPDSGPMQSQQSIETLFSQAIEEAIKSMPNDALANGVIYGLGNAASLANQQGLANKQGLANQQGLANKQGLAMSGKHSGAIVFSTVQLSNAVNVISAYNSMVSNVAPALQESQNLHLASQIGVMIQQTAIGNKPSISLIPDL